jgi:hypothetical protein
MPNLDLSVQVGEHKTSKRCYTSWNEPDCEVQLDVEAIDDGETAHLSVKKALCFWGCDVALREVVLRQAPISEQHDSGEIHAVLSVSTAAPGERKSAPMSSTPPPEPTAPPPPPRAAFGRAAAKIANRVVLPNVVQAGEAPEPGEAATDEYRLCAWSHDMIGKRRFAKAEDALVHALLEKSPMPWTRGDLLYNLGLVSAAAGDAQSAYGLFHMSLEVRPEGPAADTVARECAKLKRGSCIYTRDANGNFK